MDILAPVSSIMSTNLVTVTPEDSLYLAKELMDKHRIHHLPVVRFREIVGIISYSDLLYFLKGLGQDTSDNLMNEIRLKNYKAKSIMTVGLAKLESTDRINVALEVFKTNRFHALPIVDNGELVGIVTTYDIIIKLAEEKTSTAL